MTGVVIVGGPDGIGDIGTAAEVAPPEGEQAIDSAPAGAAWQNALC